MQFSSVSFRTGCSHVPKAICSALHVLRSAGYLPSDWNAVLFYCAYHYPKEIPSLHWGFRQGRGSPLLQPLPIVVFQRSLWIKTEEIFLSLLLFSFPPLPSGEAAGWSLPASHILLCLLPLFSHFLKNIVFFQVLYSYSVLAIKVPSQPFSFTLWLWPFVRLRIFRVNRSLRSPRMLFSFIHSALWMEQPGVGSGSAALHSESTQSFFFQGPFKIRPKVCRGAWRSVSHAASYISLPATTESEEQRRDESKKPTVKEKGGPSGLWLPCQCGTLWGHLYPLLPSPPPTWQGPWAPGPGQSVAPTGHSLSPGAQWAEGTPPVPSAHPPAVITSDSWPSFSGGKRPLLCIFIAKCLGTVPWDW